jgi:hypothetical protein
MSGKSVVQPWVSELPLMQQTVLLTAVRGPDGIAKYSAAKYLLRWYRRCVLLSSIDGGIALTDPFSNHGGSFTGPTIEPPRWNPVDWNSWVDAYQETPPVTFDQHVQCLAWEPVMDGWVTGYLSDLDAMPLHYHLHAMHAYEIVGYQHPDERIANWWRSVYFRLVKDLHLTPETRETLNHRLSDDRAAWLAHGDEATNA